MDWISVKDELPPLEAAVECRESDFRGDFSIDLMRKAYSEKSPKFLRKVGWRWMVKRGHYWDRYSGSPEFWRLLPRAE